MKSEKFFACFIIDAGAHNFLRFKFTGFNDQGEMIPFQGGTNEEVINKLYKTLNEEGHQDNLKFYWYTSKDQTKPLSAAAKKRNCHGMRSIFGCDVHDHTYEMTFLFNS